MHVWYDEWCKGTFNLLYSIPGSAQLPPTFLLNKPAQNFIQVLADLERVFALQLYKIRLYLYPPSHAVGPRKPTMMEQETRLLGEEEDE